MGWTKQALIDLAYVELSLRGFEFDLDPDEEHTALRRLEAMMATWNGAGLRVGYAAASDPSKASLDVDSNLPDWANEAAYLGLALRLMAGYGKAPHPETKANFKTAFNVVQLQVANPIPMQYPSSLPLGAGNKPWRVTQRPFFPPPCDPLQAGGDGYIEYD